MNAAERKARELADKAIRAINAYERAINARPSYLAPETAWDAYTARVRARKGTERRYIRAAFRASGLPVPGVFS